LPAAPLVISRVRAQTRAPHARFAAKGEAIWWIDTLRSFGCASRSGNCMHAASKDLPMTLFRTAALATAALTLAACSAVQPWERDVLARPSMQLSTSPVIDAIDDHIYFSKEAATGGRSFGGGGCGCN
jgi:hypothetical protein